MAQDSPEVNILVYLKMRNALICGVLTPEIQVLLHCSLFQPLSESMMHSHEHHPTLTCWHHLFPSNCAPGGGTEFVP